MADTTPNGKSGGKSSWSDAEKIALLFSIIESKGGIVWKDITLPEGRTEKACMHVISKLRDLAKGTTGGAGANKDATGQAPKKTPGQPGRGANGQASKRKPADGDAEDGEGDVDDNEEAKPKAQRKPRAKKVKTEVKEEPAGDEEA